MILDQIIKETDLIVSNIKLQYPLHTDNKQGPGTMAYSGTAVHRALDDLSKQILLMLNNIRC